MKYLIDYPNWPTLSRKVYYEIDLSWIKDLKINIQNKVVEYNKQFSTFLITGMGGSGIVGDIVRDVFNTYFPDYEIIISKTFELPGYVCRKINDVLAIAVSYSGNTIETIKVFEKCLNLGIPIIGVSTNGKLEQYCSKYKIPFIKIPKVTAPRYGLPVLLYTTLNILKQYIPEIDKFIDDSIKVQEIANNQLNRVNEIASKLINKIPIVYIPQQIQSIGIRFKNDLNENAKHPAIIAIIPESEHNDLAIHMIKQEYLEVITISSNCLSSEYQQHINAVKKVLENYNVKYIDINLLGNNLLSNIMHGVTLLGLVSLKLAELKNVDPIKIEPIDLIKKFIS